MAEDSNPQPFGSLRFSIPAAPHDAGPSGGAGPWYRTRDLPFTRGLLCLTELERRVLVPLSDSNRETPGSEPGDFTSLPKGAYVGQGGRARTCDLRIPSAALFQLSYTLMLWRSARDSNPFLLIDSQASYLLTSRPVIWLEWQDSNLRCCGSKPHALPLGHTPVKGA